MVMRTALRVVALATASLMLVTACATGSSYRHGSMAVPPHSEESGDAYLSVLPSDFAPVQVGEEDFTAALTTLVLDMPLRVAAPRPRLPVGRQLALVSASMAAGSKQSELTRSYGRFCERQGTPGDCLSLLEDGAYLRDEDLRRLALALAVGPALEGVNEEVRALLDPTRLLATVSIGITAYLALVMAPVPEPITKGVAAAFTVLMWGYLGWEFFDLMRAYARLHEEAPRAESFEQVREIGERFGRQIGPNSVRILVLVGTAAVGETAALLSKVPKLPGSAQAARQVERATGLHLAEAVVAAERVVISMPEGTVRLVLAPHVMAMAPRSLGGGRAEPGRGGLLPNGHRAFESFDAFKRHMGKAGEGKQWHHIVGQHKANMERFGAEALHNTENVVPISRPIHERINAYYSSIQKFSGGVTVREWLGLQSYEAQRTFGLKILRDQGVVL